MVDIRLLHLPQELAGIGGERLDVAALALGEDRVEGQTALPRAGEPGDDDQLISWNDDVDIFEIMFASATNNNPVLRHSSL